jgi:Protein of unknown function (DUF2946)
MINWQRRRVGSLMRRRLRKFLPIVLIAMTVQIFAPIAACWAATVAASDPLHAAAICHGGAAAEQGQTSQTDPTGQQRAYDGCCSVCSVLHTGAPVDTPQTAVTTSCPQPGRVVWRDSAPDLFGSRSGSHAQARAPPLLT